MAKLPEYQSSGIMFSNAPSLDFANVRESIKTSQSLSSSLDRLSEFASKQALEQRVKEAEQYTVNNPPTPEQLARAKEGTFDPNELIPSGGKFVQEAVKKLQGEQLKNVLHVETQNDYMQILNEVKDRKILSDEELKIKLEAPIIGRSKTLAKISPEAAMSFNALAAANGFQIRKAANEQFELNAKLEYDELTTQSIDSGLPLMREIVKQNGTSNPQATKDQIQAILEPIKRLSENGTNEAQKQIKKLEDELENLAVTGLDKTKDSAVRLASTGDKRAESALFIAIQEMDDYSLAMNISPQVREKYINNTIEEFHVARIEAEYSVATDKQGYLNKLQADMKKGPIGNLFDKNGTPIKTNRITRGVDFNKLDSIINGFEADIRARRAEGAALRAELKSDITEAKRIQSLGSLVPQAEISSLAKRARALGIPESDNVIQQINSLTLLNQDTAGFRKMNDVQLSSTLRKWQSETKDGASLIQAERIDNLQKYRSSFVEGLSKDPVAMMNKSGMDVATLDFSASDKDFKMQVADRVKNAKIFASHNTITPKFLSADESMALSTYLQTADTESQIKMLNKIQSSFGKDAYTVMSQISKQAPEYAHIAGMMSVGARQNTVKDALIGIKQQQLGNKVSESPTLKNNVIANVLGNSFSKLPSTRSNIVKVADAIYTSRIIQSGRTDVFDDEVYESALQEASGAVRSSDGKDWWGGVYSNSKGYTHVIPTNVKQSEFEDIVEQATYLDFAMSANGELFDSKGKPYSVDKLRNAYLVEDVNQDNMRLYYGNPNEPSSQQFYTKDGQPLIINYRRLVDRVKGK